MNNGVKLLVNETLARLREEYEFTATLTRRTCANIVAAGFNRACLPAAFVLTQLAVELQQDILPVALCDTNTAMPRDAYWFEPYHATVRALPRVTPRLVRSSIA